MSARSSKQEIIRQNGQPIMRGEYYEGPFPRPEDLEKYEALQPGLIERIFTYAESEQAQRHHIQNKRTDTESFDVRSNFWAHAITNVCVTAMFISLLAVGAFALYLGYTKTAIAIFAVPIGRMIIAMTRMTRKEPARDMVKSSRKS